VPLYHNKVALGGSKVALGGSKVAVYDTKLLHLSKKRNNFFVLRATFRNFADNFAVSMGKGNNNQALIAHLSMFGACAGWGLMAPVGKDAMTHGFDGITMVTFRVVGACLLFWIASLFAKKEHVPGRDKLMFIGAAVFGLVCNQCCYTLGLSITSPINASIVTTSMPIFAMLLAALILKEPITGKKALGVMMGCSGALILILTSAAHASDKVGDIRGDVLCLFAQFSFALYLSLFNPLIRRYNVFTINRYMFSWATLILLPFTFSHVAGVMGSPIPARTWWEVAYVVGVGTFLGYILTMIGQRVLRPTVVSVYNYVQPIVSVAASLLMGIGILKASHALAVILVFGGVWLVTKSKSRRDMEAKEPSSPEVLQTQVEDQHAVAGNDGVA
jgi:drug/metabolite transporter (DMT)-like permease